MRKGGVMGEKRRFEGRALPHNKRIACTYSFFSSSMSMNFWLPVVG
jgi:hypothetical protein